MDRLCLKVMDTRQSLSLLAISLWGGMVIPRFSLVGVEIAFDFAKGLQDSEV